MSTLANEEATDTPSSESAVTARHAKPRSERSVRFTNTSNRARHKLAVQLDATESSSTSPLTSAGTELNEAAPVVTRVPKAAAQREMAPVYIPEADAVVAVDVATVYVPAPAIDGPQEISNSVEDVEPHTVVPNVESKTALAGDSFFGSTPWMGSPAAAEAAEPEAEPSDEGHEAESSAPESAFLAPLDFEQTAPSFDRVATPTDSLGAVDHGPELEIIIPQKDPFFTWRGKPIGAGAKDQLKPTTLPALPAQTQPQAPAPAKVQKKNATGTVRDGIDPRSWFGETVDRALREGASDIHASLNGLKTELVVRVRIDGQMQVFASLLGEDAQRVMGIFKASAEFASGGSYAPEEAIYGVEVDGEQRKARAVLFRTQDAGDALVMRLPPMGAIRTLEELEFSTKNLDLFHKLLVSSNRMLLIAGPMGSGKTTTAHAAIMHVATADRAVWTVEDPVERKLPGLTQLEVDEDNGAGFDKLLPSLVRADYDTLFLGEIRDKATAQAGVRQAKAGRQVISTIHSNDNVTAVLRLIELAEDTPLSVMDAVKGVVSQRLVRRLNPEWDGENPKLKYKGRIPIHEVLMMNDDLVEAVMEQRPLSEIKISAAATSASTFAEDAARLVDAGITDVDEINKVLGEPVGDKNND